MGDARKVPKIGVTKNVATHEILSRIGSKKLDMMQSGADEKNINRLIKDRVDVSPTAYYAGIYSARKTLDFYDGSSVTFTVTHQRFRN